MSIANDIATAISTRLESITIADGYDTDIGTRVMRGRKRIDKSHLPCAVVIERDDNPLSTKVLDKRTYQAKIAKRIILEGHDLCDADNPNDQGHKLVADLKRAIFSAALTYGANQEVLSMNYVGCSIAPREDGLDVVAAAIEVSIEYVETSANP